MPRAVLIGGTGRSAARPLARSRADGWEVVAVSRSGTLPDGLAELGVAAVAGRPRGRRPAAGGDRRRRGRRRTTWSPTVASTASSSTASPGSPARSSSSRPPPSTPTTRARALDGVGGEPPRLPVPMLESQRTAEPGDDTYSTQQGRARADAPRRSAAGDAHARVRDPRAGRADCRASSSSSSARVDGRRRVALAWNGESRFHTTSVANLAELIRLAAAQPGDRILNGGDPDPPTTLEICYAIGAALDHEFEPVLLAGDEFDNPWGVPRVPLVVSMEAAERELGYRPVTTYPEAVKETCAWLVGELERGRSWEGTYSRRDARLRGRGRGAGLRSRDRPGRVPRPLPDPRRPART